MSTPNVVLFFTDQQRWDSVGLHGNPLGLTPNFDRLAGEGTFLANSFSCQPVCAPARSCLQTGLYATQTGVTSNGAIPMDSSLKTLAHHFNDAGYQTGYIGKWHLGKGSAVEEATRGGYHYWLGANSTEAISDAYDTLLYDGDGKEVRLPGYRVDAMTDAAIRYIDEQKENPFFLVVSYLEPHHQNHRDDYVPPIGTRQTYTGAWTPPDLQHLGGSSAYHLGGYYATIKRLDECLGRVYDALYSLGLADETILLFTSDHGCHFRTRNEEYKRSCHESSIHVPTMIHGGPFTGNGVRKEMFNIPDIAPTLLDACGIEQQAPMSGRSILPRLAHRDLDWPDDLFVQISESECGRALRTHRWKYAVRAETLDGYDWDSFHFDTRASAETYYETFLYDLESDPYELVNLVGAPAYRELCDRLKGRLLEWILKVEGERPEIVNAKERTAFQRQPLLPRQVDDGKSV